MNPHHHAVIVGIDVYSRLPRLRAARNDAAAFRRWLRDVGGVPDANIAHLSFEVPQNHTEADIQPKMAQIMEALRLRIEAGLQFTPSQWDESRLYYFAAGHGIAANWNDAAILAADASPTTLGRHVSAQSLFDYLETVQAFRDVIVFADCCRTRSTRVSRMPVEWTHDPRTMGHVRKFLGCAALFRQDAHEDDKGADDERRGHFTRALLDGLCGNVPVGNDRRIRAPELENYIREHMERAGKRVGRALIPEFLCMGPPDIHFPTAPNHSPLTYPVVLRIGGAPDHIEVSREGFQPIQIPRQDGAFRVDLPIGIWKATLPHSTTSILFQVEEHQNEHEF